MRLKPHVDTEGTKPSKILADMNII
jgi:hypothetical protein